MLGVVLARKSFNSAYNSADSPVDNNLTARQNALSHVRAYFGYDLTFANNYRGFAEAKTGLLAYIKTISQKPNTALQHSYASWKSVLTNLSRPGKNLGVQSEQMFTKIAHILVYDKSLDDATKIEVLNDLYSPLMMCSAGAQGEIQSKFLSLNTRNLIDYVRNFVNSIAEEIFLLSHSNSIHARNGFLNGLSEKIRIIGRIQSESAADIPENVIAERYNLNNFFKYIESHISSVLTASDIKFLQQEEKLNDFTQKLKVFNIANDMLDNLLTVDFGGSYSQWNELLGKIMTDVESHQYLAPDQALPGELDNACLYIIKTKKDDFELMFASQKYFISKKHIRLCAGLQKYSDKNASVYDLLDLFNGVVNKEAKSYIRLNTNFVRYKLLEELGKIGMLAEQNGIEWRYEKLACGENIECVVCPMQEATQLFFINKQSGAHLSLGEVIDNKQYNIYSFKGLLNAGHKCNVGMLVSYNQDDCEKRFEHNSYVLNHWHKNSPISDELVRWLIENPAFLSRLQVENQIDIQNLVEKFSQQQLCQFFSATSTKKLMVNNQNKFLMRCFIGERDMLMSQIAIGLLLDDDIDMIDGSQSFKHNIDILQQCYKNPKFYDEFANWLPKNPRFLSEWQSSPDLKHDLQYFLKELYLEHKTRFFAHENVKKQLAKDGVNGVLYQHFISLLDRMDIDPYKLAKCFMVSSNDANEDFAYKFNMNILNTLPQGKDRFIVLSKNIPFLHKMYSVARGEIPDVISHFDMNDRYALFKLRSQNGYYGKCMLEQLDNIRKFFTDKDVDKLLIKDADIKSSDDMAAVMINNVGIIKAILCLNSYDDIWKNISAIEWLAKNPKTFFYLAEQKNQPINVDSIRKYLRNVMLRKLAINSAALAVIVGSLCLIYAAFAVLSWLALWLLPTALIPIAIMASSILRPGAFLANPLLPSELLGLTIGPDLSLKHVGICFIVVVGSLAVLGILSMITLPVFAKEFLAFVLVEILAAAATFLPIWSCEYLGAIYNKYQYSTEDNALNEASFKNILNLMNKVNVFAGKQADAVNQAVPLDVPVIQPQASTRPNVSPGKILTWFYGSKSNVRSNASDNPGPDNIPQSFARRYLALSN